MKWLLSLFGGGFYGYIIAAFLGAAIAGGGTYVVVHNSDELEIGKLKLAAETQEALDVSASLRQLQSFISGMHLAETNYSKTLDAIAANVDSLKGQWKNATAKPLPLDCFPDANRVRNVNAAVRAANNPNPAPAR